ncbi:MAG TPA: hypothetical protein ENN67_02135 [Firmicutes bacterium]|nr:hypothetical protein [Bacillota bacterium]
MTRNNPRKIRLHAIFIASILVLAVFPFGCRPPEVKVPDDATVPDTTEIAKFTWDTLSRAPRWRVDSPIRWKTTEDGYNVVSESRSTGKPIFCYVSRYDDDLTLTIEDGLFPADAWGNIIAEKFIAWEIDWWRNPYAAQKILGDISPPALLVLKVNPDRQSSEFRRVDSWSTRELLSFPLHRGILPFDNPETAKAFERFESTDWNELQTAEIIPADGIEPDEYAKKRVWYLEERLASGLGVLPEEAMLLAFYGLAHGTVIDGLSSRVEGWRIYADEVPVDGIWLPNDAFGTGSGWTIDVVRNLHAASTGLALEAPWPRTAHFTYLGLIRLITLDSGDFGGGIPHYYDIRGTFNARFDYLDDEVPSLDFPVERFMEQIPGPRDTVWANARALAWWLRLVKWSPDLAEYAFPPTDKVSDFIYRKAVSMTKSLARKAGDIESMKLSDRIYMLDLYNEIYQLTGDVSFLESGSEIAATFPEEEIDDWYDPSMAAFMSDCALSLYYYGWLTEDEEARKTADAIIEKTVGYADLGMFGEMDRVRLAYAIMVINSKCIHVAVIAGVNDPAGRSLLKTGLKGWDPRKIAQILDPERDEELIEKKGYYPMDTAMAFVCIDDMCYPPESESEGLGKVIAEVREDLAIKLDE